MSHSSTRQGSEAGVSFVELLIATSIFVIAAGTLIVGIATAGAIHRDTNDRMAAVEAALSLAEEIRATPINDVVATWGPGGSRGDTFSVTGLDREGIPAGRITVVSDETLDDTDLPVGLGMPRDLDGDGKALTDDVSSTASVMPVIIEVDWGRSGRRATFSLPVVVRRD